jgi:DNA polymerase-2
MQLWLKAENGEAIAALYPYHPAFYAVISTTPRHHTKMSFPAIPSLTRLKEPEKDTYCLLAASLEHHPGVYSVELRTKRVRAEDINVKQVLEIRVQSPFDFKRVVKLVDAFEQFELFNTDIPLSQMFYYETCLFPFAYCEVQFKPDFPDSSSPNLRLIQKILLDDSNETVNYKIPPLKVIWLEIDSLTTGIVHTQSDPIQRITITPDPSGVPIALAHLFPHNQISADAAGTSQLIIEEQSERVLLKALENAVRAIDPDVIFTANGDEHLFPHILTRASFLHIDHSLSLSRDGSPLTHTRFQVEGGNFFMSYGIVHHRAQSQFYLNGRLHIDSAIYGGLHFDDGNLYGIIEIARVCYVNLQRLTRVTIGGALQSLQFFHAYSLGVLIPEEKRNSEFFRDGAALLLSDRGGHILQPKIGLFERVAELDFTSMYPALMVQYNVSPDMLNCPCCNGEASCVPGLPYHLCQKRQGIVPLSLRVPLTKRISYKNLAKTSVPSVARQYKKMEEALKWILVVCFGYLGFRNARFGRIEAHQSVCAYAREFLLNAVEIVEKHGFIIIHGIVDSLYVQAPTSMTTSEFQQKCIHIADEISKKTKIPINFDPTNDYFDFICFLPTKNDPEIGALNRYWGIKPNKGIKIRGIEIRRHDTPPLIKRFQQEVMESIGKASNKRDFDQLLRNAIVPVLRQYYNMLLSRQISPEDLVVSIRITRAPEYYKVKNYQAIAANYLKRLGIQIQPGQKVDFVITHDKAKNPEDRVLPIEIFKKGNASYDIEKYKELLIRAVVNLLPIALSEKQKDQLYQIETKDIAQSMGVQMKLQAFLKKAS